MWAATQTLAPGGKHPRAATELEVSFHPPIATLTPSMPDVQNCRCSKGSASYWSNPPFLIFDIRALWRSVLSARAPECQKLQMMG